MRPMCRYILMMLAAWIAPMAYGGKVKLLTDSSQVYLGVPFAVAIDVSATKGHEAPEFPELEGATSQLVDTSTSSRTSRIVINGRQMGGSEKTTRYLYHITPNREGILRIPRIEVQVDGDWTATRSANLRVTKSVKGDLLFVELLGAEDSVYVGESLDVTLRVWLKEFKQRRINLNYNEMWQAIDKNASEWGVFEEQIVSRTQDVKVSQRQRVGEDGKKHTYHVYETRKRIWPTRAGRLDAGGLRVVVNYPLKVARDIFGSVRFSQSKPIFATVDKTNVEVQDIPTEGRPAGYSGAVGGHRIVTTATPKNVRVGDPITLNITVEGKSQLDHLRAPVLKEVPGFNEQFQISEDALPGVVQGKRKTFSLSLRALSDKVKEIPSIPLPYFDTDSETFKTVYSQPIPLQVSPAKRMSTMDIVQSGEPTMQNESTLTRLDEGIEANRSDIDLLLADQRLKVTRVAAPVIVGTPLIFMACLLVRRRNEHRRANSGLMIQRAAFKTAITQLKEIESQSDAAVNPDTPLSVLLVFIRDRLQVGSEVLTRSEAVEELTRAGISNETGDKVDRLIAECEAAEFGGMVQATQAQHFGNVRDAIEQIEQQLGKRSWR